MDLRPRAPSTRSPFVALLSLSLLSICLAACPDDVASTDLAQPKDQAAQAEDLAGND
jgi:hypothetical protein